MWFFMIACYVLTAVSYVMLLSLGLQGYFGGHLLGVNHPTFALLTAIVYLFTETLVIFFFVGTGVSVKEFTQEHGADPEFHRQSIQIKRRLYPPLLLNILIFMVTFIIGGAVDTNRLPGFVHGLLFVILILHFTKAIMVQHRCFKENTAIILAMSGIDTKLEMGSSQVK